MEIGVLRPAAEGRHPSSGALAGVVKNTRAIIDAIHDGSLAKVKTEKAPVFGFDVVAECPNVPSEILIPLNAWADKAAYDATAKKLANLFNKNFETYAPGASAEVKAAAPIG